MRTLTRTWAILLALTAVSIGAGHGSDGGGLGLLGAGLVLMSANFKADQILTHYLDLRHAGSGWRTLFRIMLTLLGGAIFGIYALAPLIGALPR